jgi:hypothetical protein
MDVIGMVLLALLIIGLCSAVVVGVARADRFDRLPK